METPGGSLTLYLVKSDVVPEVWRSLVNSDIVLEVWRPLVKSDVVLEVWRPLVKSTLYVVLDGVETPGEV